ncbi:GGDEF domain-containing protein [Mesorhizobium sp. BR115XR7A]|uniref:sensor domain-containing diguanylate cyclase n=1 Tax=Mesorhizobium sp. BR115XR7A TaxID=2876645 RepID=UPI001CCBAA18|nr:GGDEF domain-containing protein [Mesorhizobium sp. BR115XR7A]MBZ9907737.1 GGDEF domain-containing protein [Mesorhizobium sp. BR115XR7A]MBZ9929061.1 GGDEF domain-containing protein [Mesorhizobium sp. BR1-1-5]
MDEPRQQLAELYDETPVLVAIYDSFDRLRYANRAFRSIFYVASDEAPSWADLMRRNHAEGRGTVIHAADMEKWLVSAQSRRGKTGFRAFETDLVDGRWLWMTETVQSDGWMLCIASDITAIRAGGRSLRQDRDRAIKASHTDELTGVANRRFVTGRIEELIRGAGDGSGSICVLDLDNFKCINDRFGHGAGDIILQDFAKRIQKQVRRSDCFGRIGGEEFVLVLPRTGMEEAELIVERMLATIRTSRPLQDRAVSYTFSAGIAEVRLGETVAELLGRADHALYSAKVGGRNRIHLYAA